jgi:hypothetical protein
MLHWKEQTLSDGELSADCQGAGQVTVPIFLGDVTDVKGLGGSQGSDLASSQWSIL